MENRIGDQQPLHRDPPFPIPTSPLPPLPETHAHHLHQYPLRRNNLPETSLQNPSFIETDPGQTLESAFTRLNLSANHRWLSFLSSGLDGGSILGTAGNDVIGGGGFLPLSFRNIPQTNDGLQRSSMHHNRLTTGHMGLQDNGHYPMMVGSESERWGSFIYYPDRTPVISKPYSELWNVGMEEESDDYWPYDQSNQYQSFLQRLSRPPRELIKQFPIRPCSSENRFFIDSTRHSPGLMDGLVTKKPNNLRPSLYDHRPRRLQQYLNYLSVEDLRGRIVSLAKDQYGCRFLQTKFEDIKDEEIEMIFSEVIDHVGELMIDPVGNYLVQKLVEVCNEQQRTRIIISVTDNSDYQLVDICLNPHGTRAVQKLLEHLTTPRQISLVMSALSASAVRLTLDMNGHHVIQHCLKNFSLEDNKYLLNGVADNCFGIATDKSGCCVLQLCVEHSQGEPRQRLVAAITENALILAEDRYGNYVVQHILELKIPQVTPNLLRQFEGSYFSLSCSKAGSNVVEKCLHESGEEQAARIIIELLRNPDVSMLLQHPFGNYVIQSALSVSKGVIHNALRDLVLRHYRSMRTNLYGKKVLDWFVKRNLQLV